MEQEQERAWVLLVYKIPREPTASRAQVWRKLKRLGALLLHDAVWVLPATPWTREQFQARVDAAYQKILEELEQEGADLVALSRTYQQVRAQDYFHSTLGTEVKERLMSARGGYAT